MRKTVSILAIAFGILAFTQSASSQQAGKVYRIGILHPNDITKSTSTLSFIQRLSDLGYVQGQNITILKMSARGQRHRLPNMAEELLRQKVDVIVGPGSGVWAAIEKTRTTPIVVAVAGNFVTRGWAYTLRRPGRNITGLSTLAPGLTGKQLQLLKEVTPNLSRVAVIAIKNDPEQAEELREAKEAAPGLSLKLIPVFIKDASDLTSSFIQIKTKNADGILVLRHGYLLRLRQQMASHARKFGLPTMFGHAREAAAGGLMAYGADTRNLWRGAADYVDKILKGVSPAELPISQATKFNLTINLKTAKEIGVAFPSSILLQANKVIE